MGAGQVASVTPQGEAAFAAAHREMLRSPGLQFDFAAATPPEPPGWLEGVARILQALAPALEVVFWAGLAAGAGMVVFFIARELMLIRPRRRRAGGSASDPQAWAPEPARARALLEDADRLAAAGRYDEAVRLILHRSIDDLAGRRRGAVRPALTAREIAGHPAMPAPVRGAFEAIARAEEISFFAARPAGAADFARCREAYERFAFPGAWA